MFLVDVSGSMAGADRLPLAQQLLRQTLDLLAPEDRVSIVPTATEENAGYLDTKRDKLGHLLAS